MKVDERAAFPLAALNTIVLSHYLPAVYQTIIDSINNHSILPSNYKIRFIHGSSRDDSPDC